MWCLSTAEPSRLLAQVTVVLLIHAVELEDHAGVIAEDRRVLEQLLGLSVPRRRRLRALTCSAPDICVEFRGATARRAHAQTDLRSARGRNRRGVLRICVVSCPVSHARQPRVDDLYCLGAAPGRDVGEAPAAPQREVLVATECDARTEPAPVEPETPGERGTIRAIHLAHILRNPHSSSQLSYSRSRPRHPGSVKKHVRCPV